MIEVRKPDVLSNHYMFCLCMVWQGQQLGLSKVQDVTKIIQEPVVPTEPPPEFEFIADPPSISAFDL